MSSRLFLDIRQMFFEIWKQIVKSVSLSVQIDFSRKKDFPGKKFSLITFFRMGGGVGERFFWILWKKWTFGGKLSGGWSERDSTLPEGLFEERHIYPKTFPINKSFQTFTIILLFVVFWQIYQNAPLCTDELIEKKFLWTDNCLRFVSEVEQILSFFDNNTSTDCQNCVLSV